MSAGRLHYRAFGDTTLFINRTTPVIHSLVLLVFEIALEPSYRGSHRRILLDLSLNALRSVNHGRVVPPTEFIADHRE